MEVKVGKKKFNLKDTSIYISEMYADLTHMVYGFNDANDELEEIDLEYQAAIEEGDSKARAGLKRIRAIREIKKSASELTHAVFQKRFEILEEVLTLNGYDFDRELWEKNADVELVNDILVDLIGGWSKKKVAPPLT